MSGKKVRHIKQFINVSEEGVETWVAFNVETQRWHCDVNNQRSRSMLARQLMNGEGVPGDNPYEILGNRNGAYRFVPYNNLVLG